MTGNKTDGRAAKAKHVLYLLSMACVLLVFGLAFLLAFPDSTHLDFFSSFLGKWQIGLLYTGGAILLASLLFAVWRALLRLQPRARRFVLLGLFLLGIALQLALLFTLRASLRYDHLKIFDQALEIFETGTISPTAWDGCYEKYPFLIPITLLLHGVLAIFRAVGMPEASYMLGVQCVILLGLDLAIWCSYRLIAILRSQDTALLFALVCFLNPLFYIYGFMCYTTVLMLPFLMGGLLLLARTLAEKRWKRKVLLAILTGIVFQCGLLVRTNYLIVFVALAAYVLLHVRNGHTFVEKKIHGLYLACAAAAAMALCSFAYQAVEDRYVDFDYTDTQFTAPYYFMYSSSMEYGGSFNTADYQFIQQFPTKEEKNAAAWEEFFRRLRENGASGNLWLFQHKLAYTWSDGIDDYTEFIATLPEYSTFHSFLGGSRRDLFVLYCHIFNLMALGMAVYGAYRAFRRKCADPFYIVYLSLLGFMLFHTLWEAGWAYSISFCLLVLLCCADGLAQIRADRVGLPAAVPRTGRRVFLTPVLGLVLVLAVSLPYAGRLFTQPYGQVEYAAVQDMYEGELLPLSQGEVITQTFRTDRPFTHAGCKIGNEMGNANTSAYRIQVLDADGNVLGSKDFSGGEILNLDYCYVRFDSVVPEGMEEYTIRITGLATDEDNYLTFLYYHTGNWDMYPAGHMEGLDAGEKSDLTFVVYDSVTKCFFN